MLPAAVIARSETILHSLENGEQSGAVTKLADDLPLFAAAAIRSPAIASAQPAGPSAVELALAEVNPDELTPKQALEELYKLKGLAG